MSPSSRGVLAASLLSSSSLQLHLTSGLRAMAGNSKRVQQKNGNTSDSLDFDAATRPQYPNSARWDYFLGVTYGVRASDSKIIAIEVHSATDGKVSEVIAKKRHSKPLMLAELHSGKQVHRWVWIASGKVRFSPNSKYRRLLATERIEFMGRTLVL